MPRGSFKHEDGSKGGFGIQDGKYEVLKSVVGIHQFPPNSKTGTQSDPFTALMWTVQKLDDQWEATSDEAELLPIRLGAPADMRPGKLDPKDALNMNVEPEDLGQEVGTEGNALYIEEGKKTSIGWTLMEESLRKHGFKPEQSGSGFAPFFEGLKLSFKTVEGKPYIATKGEKKGQEVKPTNLICDHIQQFPGQKKAGGKVADKKPDAGKTNGQSTQVQTNGAGDVDAMTAAKAFFGNLTPQFKEVCKKDVDVKLADFHKEVTRELMRQKVNPKLQKVIGDVVKNPERLLELAGELMDTAGAFITDGTTVTFS